MRAVLIAVPVAVLLAVPALAQGQSLMQRAQATFKPLPAQIPAPADNPTTPEKVALGRQLFFDPRLSISGAISCNSCHGLSSYGADNLQTSLGHKFQPGARNAPTVFNSGFQVAQFWDGRAKDLEAQAKGPILNPKEMAMPNPALALARVRSIPEYTEAFKKVFGGNGNPVTYDHIAEAIAAYERTLVTPDSPFDAFLKGDAKALSVREQHGLKLFMDRGCAACHNGLGVGGASFMRFEYPAPFTNQKDQGRYDETKNPQDRYVFRVSSLRNVARTAPYFHDGKIWSLEQAVQIMAQAQLHTKLNKQETGDIVAFLQSLTGPIPAQALQLPVLPPSGPDTPRPLR